MNRSGIYPRRLFKALTALCLSFVYAITFHQLFAAEDEPATQTEKSTQYSFAVTGTYRVTLRDIEQERDEAKARLDGFMRELGYVA